MIREPKPLTSGTRGKMRIKTKTPETTGVSGARKDNKNQGSVTILARARWYSAGVIRSRT